VRLHCILWQAHPLLESLFGCLLTIDIPELPQRVFATKDIHSTKQRAKEAVCRLAIDHGVLQQLRSLIPHSAPASSINVTAAVIPSVEDTLSADQIQKLANPIGWLDACVNKYLETRQSLEYIEQNGELLRRGCWDKLSCQQTQAALVACFDSV
jgi:hypothetical protein